ncbi:MAG: hypothetical protein LBL00_08525 [Endomicrobium sp.]|jgi:hypothetical protein|nr:hypothetical protein [Endomicrobium sp.]
MRNSFFRNLIAVLDLSFAHVAFKYVVAWAFIIVAFLVLVEFLGHVAGAVTERIILKDIVEGKRQVMMAGGYSRTAINNLYGEYTDFDHDYGNGSMDPRSQISGMTDTATATTNNDHPVSDFVAATPPQEGN